MKRLFLVSLAVLLAVSLGITMFPTQSVAALEKGGFSFHIKAKGEGEYQFAGDTEWQQGEFSINVVGQKGFGYKFNRGYSGYGTPQDTAQGYIRGSFGEHEIDLTLKNPGGRELIRMINGKINFIGFECKGTYDGSKVISHQSYIRVSYDEDTGELDYILADLCFTDGTIWTYLDVTMYDASLDLHQNPN